MEKPDYFIEDILVETIPNKEKATKDMLKDIRKIYQMTQKEIAEILDIPLDTWQQWERGRREPPKYMIKLILYTLKYKINIEKKTPR